MQSNVALSAPQSLKTSFVMPNGDVHLSTNWKPNTGGTGSYSPLVGSGKAEERIVIFDEEKTTDDVTIVIHTPYSDFTGLRLDEKQLIPITDYTLKSGSTLITLKRGMLSGFDEGDRKLAVMFTNPDGTAEIALRVVSEEPGVSPSPSPTDSVSPVPSESTAPRRNRSSGGCDAGYGMAAMLALGVLGMIKRC